MCGAEACSMEIRGQLPAVRDGGRHLHLLSCLSGPTLGTSESPCNQQKTNTTGMVGMPGLFRI